MEQCFWTWGCFDFAEQSLPAATLAADIHPTFFPTIALVLPAIGALPCALERAIIVQASNGATVACPPRSNAFLRHIKHVARHGRQHVRPCREQATMGFGGERDVRDGQSCPEEAVKVDRA